MTRPDDPTVRAALARRWAELPAVVKTSAQVLCRFGVGCEGTHGMFPACNLACTPCYHSRDANRVRVDVWVPETVHAAANLLLRRQPSSGTIGRWHCR